MSAGAPMTPEDLAAIVDVMAGALPEYAGVRITRPWALAAAAGATASDIADADLHRSPADAAAALAEAIRALRPLDHGNGAFAIVAENVALRLAAEG